MFNQIKLYLPFSDRFLSHLLYGFLTDGVGRETVCIPKRQLNLCRRIPFVLMDLIKLNTLYKERVKMFKNEFIFNVSNSYFISILFLVPDYLKHYTGKTYTHSTCFTSFSPFHS